jgi:signal transduction histidine kinase
VIANLLTNALRYTPAHGEIIIKAWEDGNKDRELRVAIIDNGTGIPPGDIDHIFDRFYKSAESRGTGLGLAIARGLVNAHEGVIRAEKLQDGGTSIWFSIPRQDYPHP